MWVMEKLEENPTKLEQEFTELEGKLVEKIKIVYKQDLKKYPAGVSIEIAANQEKDFRLYIDSNGAWSVRYQMSGGSFNPQGKLKEYLESSAQPAKMGP